MMYREPQAIAASDGWGGIGLEPRAGQGGSAAWNSTGRLYTLCKHSHFNASHVVMQPRLLEPTLCQMLELHVSEPGLEFFVLGITDSQQKMFDGFHFPRSATLKALGKHKHRLYMLSVEEHQQCKSESTPAPPRSPTTGIVPSNPPATSHVQLSMLGPG